MKYAFCNEMFTADPFGEAFAAARACGYQGVEFAPFTFLPDADPFDAGDIPAQRRRGVRQQLEQEGLEAVGLHWLLARTKGLHLTSPDPAVQRSTAAYLGSVAQLCADLGGTVMVLGSPQQRNLLPGVTHAEAMAHAADVLRLTMPRCADLGVTIAVEPLAPREGDFLNTAQSGVQLVRMVDAPHCQLHLDTKAMATESLPIPQIIRDCREHLVHFHTNDPNLLGPGMGELDFGPIVAALQAIGYQGWVSVEVFDYSPGPEQIARQSIEYLRGLAAVAGTSQGGQDGPGPRPKQ